MVLFASFFSAGWEFLWRPQLVGLVRLVGAVSVSRLDQYSVKSAHLSWNIQFFYHKHKFDKIWAHESKDKEGMKVESFPGVAQNPLLSKKSGR